MPLTRGTHHQKRTTNGSQAKISVGVDAALSPAERNRKIAQTIGETEKCSVGADDPVRPLGTTNYAATYRKNDHAPCGESAASPPTSIVRIRIGTFVFVGACRRADRGVRPYGCVRAHRVARSELLRRAGRRDALGRRAVRAEHVCAGAFVSVKPKRAALPQFEFSTSGLSGR